MSTALPHQPAGRGEHTWYNLQEVDDASEPVPTELNTVDCARFLAVSKDKLTVRYVGRGNHSQDVGSIRTNWPCPQRSFVYYYEVTIVDAGTRGSIAVGLADGSFELNRQPGWEPSSYGYHGYDGRRYVDSERGEQYGPRFGTGDIIGCGLLTDRRELFFTKNGSHLGVAFSCVSGIMHPTVGLHSPGEKVAFNLGTSPFAFDIASFSKSQYEARNAQVLCNRRRGSTPRGLACMPRLQGLACRDSLQGFACRDSPTCLVRMPRARAPCTAPLCMLSSPPFDASLGQPRPCHLSTCPTLSEPTSSTTIMSRRSPSSTIAQAAPLRPPPELTERARQRTERSLVTL